PAARAIVQSDGVMMSNWRSQGVCVIVALTAAIGSALPAAAQQPDIAAIYRRLQDFYAAGNYVSALIEAQNYEAAIKARFGIDHVNYAFALNNLATMYQAQGKYGEAEGLYRRALAIEEKALGPSHPDVASALNNLATVYRYQGKYGEAEGFY